MNKLLLLESHSRIVLASESKPRSAVLAQVGLPFETMTSGFPENLPKKDYSPEEYALENARMKATIVHSRLKSLEEKILVVIGCDTVINDGQGTIIEKPKDAADARGILKSFSGKSHKVHTGVHIVVSNDKGKWTRSFTETTQVRFAPLTDAAIEAYLRTGEPMNKAGAYGIQGLGALLIESIEGDYNNVVGLPLFRIFESLGGVLDQIEGTKH